ncbi:MAG: hypothetical protein HC884_02460 [Chloroflexaceae bacterium]|nr:hypothetical protein [Chloroflexaceae bacterium]
MNMVRRWIWALVVLGVIGAVLAGWHRFRGEAVQAQTDRRCFAETNLCIEGAIRQYWERNGGLTVFGYPITAQATETVEEQDLLVQWFERDRLEDHGSQGVMAGRLGARVLELQGRPWETSTKVTSAPDGCQYFELTGHSLCEPFLSYWRTNGGLERFGYPITEPMDEKIENWTGTVQYFERRRMEHHPENQQPYDILLGLLGREVREKQSNQGQDSSPTPSQRIAYTSLQGGSQDVYVCYLNDRLTCSEMKRLTKIDQNDGRPAWSPDGQQIAFESDLDRDWGVYSVPIGGSPLSYLTEAGNNKSTDGNPSWADIPGLGWRVAFQSNRNGNYDIFLVDSDTTQSPEAQPLIINDGIDRHPALSPDGGHIAFASDRAEGNDDLDIYVADLVIGSDGKTVSLSEQMINLTHRDDLRGKCGHPAWSPDSTRILFENETGERQADIWVVNADGTGDPQNLTSSSSSFDGHPDWSPDGQHIVFQSYRAGLGHFDIFIMNADGSNARPVIDIDVDVVDPDWWGPTPTPTPPAETPTTTPAETTSPPAVVEATPTPTP